MDEGTDRCRAFHSVRKPDVQREHCRLTGTTDEHQEECGWQDECGARKLSNKFRIGTEVIVECSYIEAVEQDTDKEEQIGETCNNECLL